MTNSFQHLTGDPLVTAHEMQSIEAFAIDEFVIPGRALMEVAGRSVARVAQEILPRGAAVDVVCGCGNNGGDGFVVARALHAAGYPVGVWLLGDVASLQGDARGAYDTLNREGEIPLRSLSDEAGFEDLRDALKSCDLVVDGLFGTGLQGSVRPTAASLISLINAAGVPILSIDMPSGVHADSGEALGTCISATETVTFHAAKRGQLLYPGRGHTGRLTVVDIGIPRLLNRRLGVASRVLRAEHGIGWLPPRDPEAHKGTFGHCVVWAGAQHTPGAAVLAIQSVLQVGTGLVSWVVPEDIQSSGFEVPAECMPRPYDTSHPNITKIVLDRASALVVGPGLGTDEVQQARLGNLLDEAEVPICLDADALNMLAEQPRLWERVRAPTVLTPHPKEMARLLGTTVEDVQKQRFQAALRLASHTHAVVVLKGAGTIVAEPGGEATLVAAGNPGMAVGGSGDVLAGIIGGFLAQGMEPALAAKFGALLHGAAGDEAREQKGEVSMTARDIVDNCAPVLTQWMPAV